MRYLECEYCVNLINANDGEYYSTDTKGGVVCLNYIDQLAEDVFHKYEMYDYKIEKAYERHHYDNIEAVDEACWEYFYNDFIDDDEFRQELLYEYACDSN